MLELFFIIIIIGLIGYGVFKLIKHIAIIFFICGAFLFLLLILLDAFEYEITITSVQSFIDNIKKIDLSPSLKNPTESIEIPIKPKTKDEDLEISEEDLEEELEISEEEELIMKEMVEEETKKIYIEPQIVNVEEQEDNFNNLIFFTTLDKLGILKEKNKNHIDFTSPNIYDYINFDADKIKGQEEKGIISNKNRYIMRYKERQNTIYNQICIEPGIMYEHKIPNIYLLSLDIYPKYIISGTNWKEVSEEFIGQNINECSTLFEIFKNTE